MNERGLQSTACHRVGKETTPTGYVALLQKPTYKPEPVTNQSSKNECGHIYFPFGCGGGNGREGKSSCGLMPQTTKATGGLQLQQGNFQFSARDTMLSLR